LPQLTIAEAWAMSTDTLQPGAMLTGPLYAEVKRRITKSLMDGEWPQGTPIPSEAQLAQRYAVSMGTVRKAIGQLVAEKILVRQAGRGTFAANHNRDYMLDAYFHIVDDKGDKEFPESTLLSFRQIKADAQAARHLRLRPGDRVFDFENLLRLHGRPAIFDHIRVPQAVFPDFEEAAFRNRNMTIFGFYQSRYGVTVARLEERIRAENADARLARLLELERDAAVLKIDRVGYTYDGTPVEFRQRFINTRHHAYLNVLGMKQA
jgi:GntR family transcriptional regulator